MDDLHFPSEGKFATEVGEWICEKTALAFKYIMISMLCGIGGTIGFLIVYIAFLQFGGLTWLLDFVMNAATM